MVKNWNELWFPSMRRVSQIDDDHCGPAVVEMLVSFFGKYITQTEIVKAVGIEKKIVTHGMFVEEMGEAIKKLTPEVSFWYKKGASLRLLSMLVNQYRLPVGVEWQGIFEDVYFDDGEATIFNEDESHNGENEDIETGHYSVVTGISTGDNWLTLADPYHNRGVDRQITILEFERRWWDINELVDEKTGRKQEQDDYHVLFLVSNKEIELPAELELDQFG